MCASFEDEVYVALSFYPNSVHILYSQEVVLDCF